MGDDFYDDFDPDFDPGPDCDHEDYELDILIGRATCTMCNHRFYMSEDELRRHHERLTRPVDGEEGEG